MRKQDQVHLIKKDSSYVIVTRPASMVLHHND